MEETYKINRLETTKRIGPMVDAHWAGLREAKEQGKLVAWSMGPLFPLAYAMDIPCHFHAGYASYCGGRKGVPPLLEAAEADGHIVDTCSYHRLHMGMIAAIKKGNVDVKPEVLLPIPDVVLSARLCTEHTHQSDSIYRHLNAPTIVVDLPPPHSERDIKLIENYVKEQIYQVAIPALEDLCGRRFNYGRLTEILKVLKQAALMRNKCWRFFEKVPSPWTLWDYGVSIAPVFYLMGQPGTIEYYQDLEAELASRAEQGIGSMHPEEKYRVYWDGWIPWSFLGVLSRKLLSHGANPVVGRYPWEFFPHADKIDPSKPVDTLVEQWYTNLMACRSSPEFALPFVEEKTKKYKVDGIIMYAARTCRLWNIGQLEIINEMERKHGIPGVVLEADMLDPKFFSDAQIDIRLQALFEMIDARRKAKTRRKARRG